MSTEAPQLRYQGCQAQPRSRRQWDREQQALVRSVAHEIRSTLASVTISAEALSAAPDPPPQKVRRHAQVITEHAYHVGRLVDDLVAVVADQVEDGRVGVVEVNEIVWEAAQQLWQLAKHRSIELQIVPSAEPVAVRGQRSYLVQAVRGCLGYGLLSLAEDSQISLSVECRKAPGREGAVEVLLEYTPSVSDPQLPHAYPSPAWDQVTMCAVRRIVEAHKGDVTALGDDRQGLRLLLPRYRSANMQQRPRTALAQSRAVEKSDS